MSLSTYLSPLYLLATLSNAILHILRLCWTQQPMKAHYNDASISTPSSSSRKNILFVLAHPDDESMFFLPTIQSLLEENHSTLYFLFFTSGNFNEQGKIRFRELQDALRSIGALRLGEQTGPSNSKHLHRISSLAQIQSNMTAIVVDREDWFPDIMKDPCGWNEDMALQILDQTVSQWNIDQIMTFDDYGISGHPNHVKCYEFVKLWMGSSQSHNPSQEESGSESNSSHRNFGDIPCYSLDSIPIWRKYLSFWDVILNFLFASKEPKSEESSTCPPSHLSYLSHSVLQVVHAMECHYSQWVWFRKLFVLFSRYSFMNTWRLIDVEKKDK